LRRSYRDARTGYDTRRRTSQPIARLTHAAMPGFM